VDLIENLPPTISSRSLMPSNPNRPFPFVRRTRFTSKDLPSSVIVRQIQSGSFFYFNFHRAGLRMDSYVIEGLQGDAIEDGTLVNG
jgi:hypothetical protein